MTFTHALPTNNYGTAKFIVSSSVANGTHTTIASALTAASSGDTIFIRPGTYTENLTLKAGVNLTGFGSDGSLNGTGHVIISGTCTMTTAGSVTISGIQLQTNSAALLAVTGSAASIVNLQNCYLNMTNNTGITFSTSSSSASIILQNCRGDLGTTGIAVFSHSSAGTLTLNGFICTNSGGSSTASTVSAGTLGCSFCILSNPVTSSGTAAVLAFYSQFNTLAQNVTALTLGGSGGATIDKCSIAGGTASALSVGATATVTSPTITSSNTNAVTGAGTITYTNIAFNGSSSVMNTTTQTAQYTNLGKWKASGQPAFLGTGGAVVNVTGAGGTYTLGSSAALTEIFDQGGDFNTNGTFTAPVTGRYYLNANGALTGCTVNTANVTAIITSNRNYACSVGRAASATDLYVTISALADMDAADTATVSITGFGEAGATDDISANSFFSGVLLA